MSEKEQLFERIVQENRHRVYRICRAYLSDPDDANDLYQDILLKVWLNLGSFRGEAKYLVIPHCPEHGYCVPEKAATPAASFAGKRVSDSGEYL